MHDHIVAQPNRMLGNLLAWMDEAEALAVSQGDDPEHWLEKRLAEDMFTFTKQVQSACDNAKFLAARCSGVTPPRHADDERTIAELRARIADTRAFLDTVDAASVDAHLDDALQLPFLPEGTTVVARNYATAFAIPNFYFHLVTAYGILRHHGVPLGKRTFIGNLPL